MTKGTKKTDVAGTEPAETTPAAKDAAPPAKRSPVATLWLEDVGLSIWSRDHLVRGKMQAFFSITFERSFKDRDGAKRYTKSFEPDSLGKIVALCQQASDRIPQLQQEAEQRLSAEQAAQ